MTLNLTLPLQILHFLIAYWFLRRWLFTPLFDLIAKEDAQTQATEAQLNAEQEKIAAVQHETQAELDACASYFSSNKPMVEEQPPTVVRTHVVEVAQLSPAERTKLQQELVSALMEKAQK